MNRSIDIGSVISRMFSIYADQASVLLPAAAVVFVAVGDHQRAAGRDRSRCSRSSRLS